MGTGSVQLEPMRHLSKYLFPAAIIGFLGLLYLRTLAPGLTWAFDGADGGDLITAAVTGGVPHPTGYPTYLLLAAAFLRIPLGSLAYRTNLLSAVCTVSASLLIYFTVAAASASRFAGLIAGISFGTFPLVWSQAIITEVNALHALFVAAVVYAVIAAEGRRGNDVAAGLLAGLGIGNHISMVLAVPLLALSGRRGASYEQEERGRAIFADAGSLLRRLAGLGLGLSVYLVIPYRATRHAPVNWEDASSWPRFLALISGRIYWDRLGHFDAAYLWTAFKAWSHLILLQLVPVGLVLVFVTLAVLLRRSSLYLATLWLAAIYSALAIFYYSVDSYVYLIPVLVSFSVWMGMSGNWLVGKIPERRQGLRQLAEVALLAVIVGAAVLRIPSMDLSAREDAERFANEVLRGAPINAIVIASGDESTFSLWYARFAERVRPDVAVISGELLAQPWYRNNLTYTYPDLAVPNGPAPEMLGAMNPGRRVCRTFADLRPQLMCSG